MNDFSFFAVRYKITNELLESILKGIHPKEGELFLSVCSSGDVAFALSEFGEVTAFDYDEDQIAFTQMRRDFLVNGDFINFSNPRQSLKGKDRDREKERAKYFTQERLKNIQRHTKRISFLQKNLIELTYEETFDALYLSNIIGYAGNTLHTTAILQKSSNMLKENGRLYITDGNNLSQDDLNRAQLFVDEDHTWAAEYDTYEPVYTPIVLRKVKS